MKTQLHVDVNEAYRRGYLFNQFNQKNSCTLVGEESDLADDKKVGQVLEVVAEFFIAREANIRRQEIIDQEVTNETDRDDPNNFYVETARKAFDRLNKAIKAIDEAVKRTGIEPRY